jgi:hypothetical protein
MTKRVAIGMALLSCAVTATVATAAGNLTELMQTSRMTVAAVDRMAGRFLCVEHHSWTAVADITGVTPGDIVRVERRGDERVHIAVVRTAADELSSPER